MSQELPPKSNASDSTAKKKSFLSNLATTAGAATKIVALQAERTKINTMTLPAAYRALGKDCLQQKRHLDCVAELTAQLRSVLAEIKNLSEAATGHATPQSFTDKAKAAGKHAVDVARTKQLGVKRDSIIAGIGKAIYEKHSDASGPLELVGPIGTALARVSEIEAEIGQQSQVGKGTFVTPKKMLVGGAVTLVLVGIYLVFPRTSGDNIWSATLAEEKAAAIAKYEPQFLQMLEAGDSAWDAGKKADAVQHYAQLLGQFCGYGQGDRTEVARLRNPEMARAAGRTIDFLADSGNDETAKELIKKADQSDLVIVYGSPKVNRLVIEAKADQKKEDQEVDDWLPKEKKNIDEPADDIGNQDKSTDVEKIQLFALTAVGVVTTNGVVDRQVSPEEVIRRWSETTPAKFTNSMRTAARELGDNSLDFEPSRKEQVLNGKKFVSFHYGGSAAKTFASFVPTSTGNLGLFFVQIGERKFTMIEPGGTPVE